MEGPAPPRASLKILLTLAWPVIIARATQSVMGFFDTFLVAPLGDDALAASSTGAMNSFTFLMLPMGIAFIIQSFASQLKGRGELVRARRYAWYGMMIAAITSLVTLAAIPFVDAALGLLDFTPAVRTLQREYIVIRLLSVAAVVGTEALGNWFSGLGHTGYSMRASIISLCFDLPLNWLLIEGKLGAPALGVAGAAWSTTIGSWVGFFYLAWAFHRNNDGKVARGKPLGLNRGELWRVVRFGLPNGLNWFLEFAAFAWFIDSAMVHLGTVPLAALNVVFSISSLAFMPAFGVASAGAILVGQALGAKAFDAVPRILKLTAKVTATWMVSVGLCYLIAPRLVFSLFVSDRDPDAPALLATGATLLALSTSWQLFDALGMTLSESLRAAGDTVWTLRARLVMAWVIFVPAAWVWIILLDGGIAAAVVCLTGYMAMLSGVFFWRFRSGAWKKIELVEDLPAAALAD